MVQRERQRFHFSLGGSNFRRHNDCYFENMANNGFFLCQNKSKIRKKNKNKIKEKKKRL